MSPRRALLRGILFAALIASAPAPAQTPAADRWQAQARDLLERAVAIRSVKDATPVAELLAAEFRKAGFPAEDVRVLPHDGTAALMVWLRAARPSRRPMMLIGHMDVVDARREDWPRDPFKLVEEGGYFYGRGTADMKGTIVAQAIALMRLRADRVTLDRDVVLFLTGDEETVANGAQRIAGEWRPLHNAEFALNGDAGGGRLSPDGKPLAFGIQTAEKTYATYTITARNRGGHSSKPRPDNAIVDLAGAVLKVAEHRFAPMLNETTKAYFEANAALRPTKLAAAMLAFAANPNDRAAADVIEADEGEVGMTRTTCVPTLLSAGHAENALPQTAVATVNCRLFPGVTSDAVRAELAQVAGPGVEVATLNAYGSGTLPSPLRPDIIGAVTRVVRERRPGVVITPEMSTGATDSGVLRERGIPAYGVNGAWIVVPDDLRAHGRDERLRVDSFYESIDYWRDLVHELAGRSS